MLTILDSLLIKTINCATVSSLWKAICAEHEAKTKRFAVEMFHDLHNQHCLETDDIRQHFVKMVLSRWWYILHYHRSTLLLPLGERLLQMVVERKREAK